MEITPLQQEWVQAARAELLSGEPEQMRAYLRRYGRDRRFDGLVMRAIMAGRAMDAAAANRAVGAYHGKMVEARRKALRAA